MRAVSAEEWQMLLFWEIAVEYNNIGPFIFWGWDCHAESMGGILNYCFLAVVFSNKSISAVKTDDFKLAIFKF